MIYYETKVVSLIVDTFKKVSRKNDHLLAQLYKKSTIFVQNIISLP